jgi:TnpA family transposase
VVLVAVPSCHGFYRTGPAAPRMQQSLNVDLIRAHWSEVLRIVASIRTGTVTASLIMRQLASYPRQNGVAAALRG